jgi:hypothetical protein
MDDNLFLGDSLRFARDGFKHLNANSAIDQKSNWLKRHKKVTGLFDQSLLVILQGINRAGIPATILY